MLRLRPFRNEDAKKVITWPADEQTFYKWSAGYLGTYPPTEESFLESLAECDKNAATFPFIAFDEHGPVGFFTIRIPGESDELVRFGFVILDPAARGKGYGKEMLSLGLRFAFDIYKAKKVTLGVFENNVPAYHCYRSIGFRETGERVKYPIMDSEWYGIELEISTP